MTTFSSSGYPTFIPGGPPIADFNPTQTATPENKTITTGQWHSPLSPSGPPIADFNPTQTVAPSPPVKNTTAPLLDHELDFSKGVIYGGDGVSAPKRYPHNEQVQRIEAYAGRVVEQIKTLKQGTESENNVKFQKVRHFLEPAGYFSGGLLAAGYDPHEKFTVTFKSYVGKWKEEVQTNTEERTYYAWELAAGALKHDRTPEGGLLNFQETEIKSQDEDKIKNLEALGARLQAHWKVDVAEPMRDVYGALAERSGKADAYVVRAILENLRNDKNSYKTLSPEGQDAIHRTLYRDGNVVIPNIYGYPLAGHAFIPFVNYHGDYDHRPNKGLLIDLKSGTVSEIYGDDDFARWAERNRNELYSSFNARDSQGGKDAHWPSAGSVLENLIDYSRATYPGYENLIKDKPVPVRETFNYTQSRSSEYFLKWGNLKSGIANEYQAVNAKNAVWADQTQVFDSEQQAWKNTKELWGRTFGYVPVLGNVGNIVFGVHDSIYGMTADDRVGGTAAAVISGLQLAHELAPYGVEAGLGEPELPSPTPGSNNYSWRYNSETRDFEFVRARQASSDSPTSTNVEPDESNSSVPANSGGALPPVEGTDVELPPLSSVENLPTGEALFSTGEKAVILSGEVDNLNVINEKLYTFTDENKKGTETRLNILVHGSFNPETGVAKVVYDGQLHNPAELLQTLHAKGVRPELFDNIRLLSCNSATGGDASFAAQFQRLIRRPVKGYSGTLTANLAPESITAAIGKIEKAYLQHVQKKGVTVTPAVTAYIRAEAEQRIADEMKVISRFKPSTKNPYWNPLKWWNFTYNPVTFPPKPLKPV